LSDQVKEIRRDGFEWEQSYAQGVATSKLTKKQAFSVGECRWTTTAGFAFAMLGRVTDRVNRFLGKTRRACRHGIS
jgi:hypothetical protein